MVTTLLFSIFQKTKWSSCCENVFDYRKSTLLIADDHRGAKINSNAKKYVKMLLLHRRTVRKNEFMNVKWEQYAPMFTTFSYYPQKNFIKWMGLWHVPAIVFFSQFHCPFGWRTAIRFFFPSGMLATSFLFACCVFRDVYRCVDQHLILLRFIVLVVPPAKLLFILPEKKTSLLCTNATENWVFNTLFFIQFSVFFSFMNQLTTFTTVYICPFSLKKKKNSTNHEKKNLNWYRSRFVFRIFCALSTT